MDRRKFLGTTAAAGVAVVASPYVAKGAKHELLVAEPVHSTGYLPMYIAMAKGYFAEADIEGLIATISKGAAQSWQMENRYKTMAADKFDFGFAVDWMRKDLSICIAEARRNGANLPVAALVDQFYAEVQKMGGSRWDTSSLIARLDR
jgi:hypothetical protein